MQEIFQILQSPWAIKALLASSMVGLMCGALGCFIVLRNMALIGDALAHAILPGVVIAFVLVGYSTIAFFTGAVLAGLFTAVGITWIQHHVNTKNDAAIGIVFTAMFAIGVMGISYISKQGGVHLDLKDFLFGNVLGIKDSDLYLTTGIMCYVLLSLVVFYRYLFATTFQPVIAETMGISVKVVHYYLMLLLSFAVVASLQTVGVIRLNRVIIIAAGVGLLSAVLGLLLAIKLDTTPGPAMALTATFLYLLAVLFAPQKGLVFGYFYRIRHRKRIQLEDTLKQALRLQENGVLSLRQLLDRLGFNATVLERNIKTLTSRRLIMRKGDQLQLTEKGVEVANRLVRAHRLWETFLVNEMGLTEEQIHEDAEKYEHLLTDGVSQN